MNDYLGRIWRHLCCDGSAPAALIEGRQITYDELRRRACQLAGVFCDAKGEGIGVWAHNHIDTYAALLGAWLCGKAYVPLQPLYPLNRLKSLVDSAHLESAFGAEQRDMELANSLGLTSLALPGNQESDWQFSKPLPDQVAYIVFTSGTTGKPKGVSVTVDNLQAFYEGFLDLGYSLGPFDRFLQMFELTFDLSILCSMFALSLGASFYTLPRGMLKNLAVYHVLESSEITFALMVPSVGAMLEKHMGELKLPSLKYIQFCGEALKEASIPVWREVCPNAQIENVYGPTEGTMYCTRYTLGQQLLARNGIVSIGKPMKHISLMLDPGGQELLLGGRQIAHGYMNPEPAQSENFFLCGGERWYRSGDICGYDEATGNWLFFGRQDHQVKIQGHRVEFGELEHAFQCSCPGRNAVAVAFESGDGLQLALFVEGEMFEESSEESKRIRECLASELPRFMMPRFILGVQSFPLNENGKVDRKAMAESVR